MDAVRGTAAFLPDLSLVAEPDRRIVGHVLVSRGFVERRVGRPLPILVLGPIAVHPVRQRAGIGAALMRRAIGRAVTRAEPLIALLGHASWYPRFGFEPARALGLEPPEAWPDEAWMALRLPPWTPELRGTVRYPEAFGIA